MSQGDASYVAIKSCETAPSGTGWREGALVLVIVLAPMGLAVIVMAIGLAARAAWLVVCGMPAGLPPAASIRLYGLLSYAVGSWIAVGLAWLWSKRQDLRRDAFLFRRLTAPALAAGIVSFAIVAFGVPVVTHWLAGATGGQSHDVRIDVRDVQSVAIVILLFVITTPLTEEVLYRGLLVAWLRRLGLTNLSIAICGSLLFAANHIIPLGFVWAGAMILLGAVLYALRLRYDSLSPAWLAHALFNAQLALSYPLIAWSALAQ